MCNLLDEGNALFHDRDLEQAVREFSEGLNVSRYAAAEDHQIPEVLLESLFVNRAAAYHSMVSYIWSKRFSSTPRPDLCVSQSVVEPDKGGSADNNYRSLYN